MRLIRTVAAFAVLTAMVLAGMSFVSAADVMVTGGKIAFARPTATPTIGVLDNFSTNGTLNGKILQHDPGDGIWTTANSVAWAASNSTSSSGHGRWRVAGSGSSRGAQRDSGTGMSFARFLWVNVSSAQEVTLGNFNNNATIGLCVLCTNAEAIPTGVVARVRRSGSSLYFTLGTLTNGGWASSIPESQYANANSTLVVGYNKALNKVSATLNGTNLKELTVLTPAGPYAGLYSESSSTARFRNYSASKP